MTAAHVFRANLHMFKDMHRFIKHSLEFVTEHAYCAIFLLEVFGWITLNERNQAGYNITLVSVDCHQEKKKRECCPTLANFTWENVNSKGGRRAKIQAFQVDLPWTWCVQIMLHCLTWVNSIWTIYLHILIYIYFLQICGCLTGQCSDQGQIIGRAELLSPVVMPVQTCVRLR